MYICVCRAVSERRISHSVAREGVATFRELQARLGVASVCGRCAPAARECLDACLAERYPQPSASLEPEPAHAAAG